VKSIHDVLTEGLTPGPSTDHRALYPGAVLLVRRRGEADRITVVGQALRYADRDGALLASDEQVPMRADTVFDVASLTKLFTTTVLMTLVEGGKVALDAPLADHLTSYRDGDRRHVTLRQLMTHTSGLPALLQLWTDWPNREARARAVLEAPLVHSPGSTFEYSCIGYITAGLLAETVTGCPLEKLVQDGVCGPLGLTDTGYLPRPELVARSAATEDESYVGRGTLRGSVHDENSWSLGGTAGNAGIFSTAKDLAAFAEMLRDGGTLGGVRVLGEESVAEMLRDQLPPGIDPGYRHGLGVRIGDRAFMGRLAEHGAVGHTGFTGTSLVVDRSRDLVVVLLTNRVHPHRDWSDIAPVRQAVADLVADLADRGSMAQRRRA
jgi:CubicO group peptidase (beta-lactamase class C family)